MYHLIIMIKVACPQCHCMALQNTNINQCMLNHQYYMIFYGAEDLYM